MKNIRAIISSLRLALARLRCQSGVALIEFAYTLPVLLVFIVGGMELTNYVLVEMEINRIATMTADNASRLQTPMTESYMNQLFEGVQKAGSNIDFQDNGRVIISSVQNNTAGTGQWICWQRCYGSLTVASKYGVQGKGQNDATLPSIGGLTAQPGSAFMYAEVYFNYHPIIPNSWFSHPQVTYEAAYVVRQRTDFSISGTGASTC